LGWISSFDRIRNSLGLRDYKMRKREIVRYFKRWMDRNSYTKERVCPFDGYNENINLPYEICKKYFKKINGIYCPCQVYSLKYVIRIAKRTVRELES